MRDFFNTVLTLTDTALKNKREEENYRVKKELENIKKKIKEEAMAGRYSVSVSRAILHDETIRQLHEGGFDTQCFVDSTIIISWYPKETQWGVIPPMAPSKEGERFNATV